MNELEKGVLESKATMDEWGHELMRVEKELQRFEL